MSEPMTAKQKSATAAALVAALAAPLEGYRQLAYQDPPGIWTVCYGSTTDVDRHKKYTLDECKARLSTDTLQAVSEVERCHPGLPMNVLVAFSDASYNIGPKVACDATKSTAARMLYEHDYTGACKQLLRWDKANVAGVMVTLPGLTKRRKIESDLCLS